MYQTARTWAVAIALVALCGCSSSVRKPSWFNPGPAGYQRWSAANQADPYPLPDIGPPVVGGRPRGFEQPVPQVERDRQYAGPPSANVSPAYAYPSTQPTYAPAPAYAAPPAYSQPAYTAPPVYSGQ